MFRTSIASPVEYVQARVVQVRGYSGLLVTFHSGGSQCCLCHYLVVPTAKAFHLEYFSKYQELSVSDSEVVEKFEQILRTADRSQAQFPSTALIGVAVLGLFSALFVIKHFRRKAKIIPAAAANSAATNPHLDQNSIVMPDFPVLSHWDESAITRQLLQLRNQKPALIPHYIESVKERWIVRQDDRTAGVRLQFLKSQVEQLKLAKEFQQTVDDLQLLSLEKMKRIKSLELETHELELKKKGLSRKEELAALKEQKEMELAIAELEQKIQAIKKPESPPRPAPIEDQIAAQEAKIKRYGQESAERQKSAGSPPEAQKWKIFYEDLINDAQEELKKLLRRR